MPSFDLLSEHAEKSASKIKKVLDKTGDFKSVIIEKREEFGEHVSSHYELIVDGRTVAFIYEPSPGACHNYNVVKINGKDVHIATTDTILSFYLLFLYIDRPYYDRDRLLCMSQYIYDLQYDKLTKNEGIFKRFSKPCIGKQVTLKDIKDAKSHMYEKLKNKKGTREFEEWFLNYNPSGQLCGTRANGGASKNGVRCAVSQTTYFVPEPQATSAKTLSMPLFGRLLWGC